MKTRSSPSLRLRKIVVKAAGSHATTALTCTHAVPATPSVVSCPSAIWMHGETWVPHWTGPIDRVTNRSEVVRALFS